MSTDNRHPKVVEAISAMLIKEPFFASLMLDLMEIVELKGQLPSGENLKCIATDGKTLWINPDEFGKYTLQERLGLIAHEIMHTILQHASRQHNYVQLGVGPDLKAFSVKRFNHAADYIINAHLTAQGFHLPLGSLQNSQVTGDDIVDEVYVKLPDDEEKKQDGPDQHEDRSEQESEHISVVQASLKKAQEIAKMQGKGCAGMERTIERICEPKISWMEYLRKAIVTQTRGTENYTWQRPNRRKLAVPPHFYMPGKSGSRGPQIGIVIDTSGSIGEDELRVFLGELSGILTDIQPEMVHVAYCDSEVHGDVIEIDDVNELENLGKKAGGGGGTDMPKGFEKFQEMQLPIETQICFTDGYTPFGEDMGIPTIWAITTKGVQAPWGTTVHVPLGSDD
jgi:predicted metal-dependent peptidase